MRTFEKKPWNIGQEKKPEAISARRVKRAVTKLLEHGKPAGRVERAIIRQILTDEMEYAGRNGL